MNKDEEEDVEEKGIGLKKIVQSWAELEVFRLYHKLSNYINYLAYSYLISGSPNVS